MPIEFRHSAELIRFLRARSSPVTNHIGVVEVVVKKVGAFISRQEAQNRNEAPVS
jgi:hypothetical protein